MVGSPQLKPRDGFLRSFLEDHNKVRSVLYITRNGLLEPLGQSQVFAYLKGLSGKYRIILVTFEKTEYFSDEHSVERAWAECRKFDIDWRPKRFRRHPRLLAPAWSLVQLFFDAWRLARTGSVGLIHARSYLPAVAAWLAWRLTKTPFIFDMRALWPEELITAGRLRRGSVLHRALLVMERACLRDAAAVVSLTEAALAHLREIYPDEMRGQRVVVIPTCADLERFSPVETGGKKGSRLRFGCCGTVVSGWFRMDWLGSLFRAASERWAEAEFEIVSRDPPDQVERLAGDAGVPLDRTRIYSVGPVEMPEILRQESANVMLYAGGEVSELGRSPTRMAEVLGCGRPVIANPGVGDVAEIVERYRVGVLMNSDEPEEIARVLDELENLLADPELSGRCRRAAEEGFSLEAGVSAFRDLYDSIPGDESDMARFG